MGISRRLTNREMEHVVAIPFQLSRERAVVAVLRQPLMVQVQLKVCVGRMCDFAPGVANRKAK